MVHIGGMELRPFRALIIRQACLLAVSLLSTASPVYAQTPSFTVVGHSFPPGQGGSVLFGVSADGRAAAGYSLPALGLPTYKAFSWHAGSGRTDFGLEAGLPAATAGQAISGDGSTVVGYSRGPNATSDNSRTAFRWSGTGTYQSLGTLPGYTDSWALGVDNDGSTVVGYASGPGGVAPRAYRWTASDGMQPIAGNSSQANAISRNGSVIVGEFAVESGAPQGYRWTQAGGLQPLASLNGSTSSYARGVSADGRYIVGVTSTSTTRSKATVWRDGLPSELAVPANWLGANPLAVSDNGQIVVGTGAPVVGGATGAAIWTPATGLESLADYLASRGAVIPAGVLLEDCIGVSSDGTTFVGTTFGPAGIVEGYVATIPAPGTLGMFGFGVFAAVRRRR